MRNSSNDKTCGTMYNNIVNEQQFRQSWLNDDHHLHALDLEYTQSNFGGFNMFPYPGNITTYELIEKNPVQKASQ